MFFILMWVSMWAFLLTPFCKVNAAAVKIGELTYKQEFLGDSCKVHLLLSSGEVPIDQFKETKWIEYSKIDLSVERKVRVTVIMNPSSEGEARGIPREELTREVPMKEWGSEFNDESNHQMELALQISKDDNGIQLTKHYNLERREDARQAHLYSSRRQGLSLTEGTWDGYLGGARTVFELDPSSTEIKTGFTGSRKEGLIRMLEAGLPPGTYFDYESALGGNEENARIYIAEGKRLGYDVVTLELIIPVMMDENEELSLPGAK